MLAATVLISAETGRLLDRPNPTIGTDGLQGAFAAAGRFRPGRIVRSVRNEVRGDLIDDETHQQGGIVEAGVD